MRYSALCSLVLGLAAHCAHACGGIYIDGAYGSNNPVCYTDPDTGSNYGVAVAVQDTCGENGVVFLSLQYTAPGGSITRTETSAQIGTTSPAFTTTFTFDIPNSYFVDGAEITQQLYLDNAPTPYTRIATETKRYLKTYVTTRSTRTISSFVTSTFPYRTFTRTQYDTSYPQTTITSACNTGTITRTAFSTITYTNIAVSAAVTSYSTLTYTNTQSIRCTAAGGGIPPNFKPRLGEYEIDVCPYRYGPGTVTLYTGVPATTTVTSTVSENPLYAYIDTTSTTTLATTTSTVCNRPAATVTTTQVRTRFSYTTPVTTRMTQTSVIYAVVTSTSARSVC